MSRSPSKGRNRCLNDCFVINLNRNRPEGIGEEYLYPEDRYSKLRIVGCVRSFPKRGGPRKSTCELTFKPFKSMFTDYPTVLGTEEYF
jgi:hypothetical protein